MLVLHIVVQKVKFVGLYLCFGSLTQRWVYFRHLAFCLKVSSCLFFCPPSNIGWTKDSMQLIVHLSTAGVLVNFRKNSKAFSLGSVNIGQDLVVVFFLCSPTIMWPLPPFFIFIPYDKRCWIGLHLSLTSMMQKPIASPKFGLIDFQSRRGLAFRAAAVEKLMSSKGGKGWIRLRQPLEPPQPPKPLGNHPVNGGYNGSS